MGTDDTITPPSELPAQHRPMGDGVDVVYNLLESLKIDIKRDIREFRKAQADALGAVFSRLSGIETRMSDESLIRQKHGLQIAELAIASNDTDKRLAFLEKCEVDRAKSEYAADEVAREKIDEAKNSAFRTIPADMLRVAAAALTAGLCGMVWWAFVMYIKSHPGG